MKISLICPVWNTPRALFLSCLSSVVNLEGATEDNFEAIFIDDGSWDGSGKVLDAWCKKAPWMKAVHQKNHGNCVARNVGMEMATGDYIAFLDCDDALYKGFLLNALDTVRTGKDVYQFNVYKRREKDDPTLYPLFPHCHGDYVFPDMPSQTWVYAWAKLIKRSLIVERNIFFPEPMKVIPALYRGALRNYVRGEDNYFCALVHAEAEVTQGVTWYGVVHTTRASSLGKRSVTKDDNGYLGLYITYRALYLEAQRRGNEALKEMCLKELKTLWVLADHSRCPSGWEPPIIE